jgi:MOSC domain-containing protein YiiM
MGNRLVETGFFKEPKGSALQLGKYGFEGDFRGTFKNDEDHAVCAYPMEHYDHFERDLGRRLAPGGLGENLTVEDATESTVRIGDVFTGREVTLQVVGPRTPCKKLNLALDARISGTFLDSTRVGYYLRVLREGALTKGERLARESPHPKNPTVKEFVRDSLVEYWDADRLVEFRNIAGLAEEWIEPLERKILRANSTVGWAGLRSLSIAEREDFSDGTRLKVRCARNRPLPLLEGGKTLGLLYRARAFESPVRFRSRKQPPDKGEYCMGPLGYELTFDRLPSAVAPGEILRFSAPQ